MSQYIKETILTGELKPGDRIVESRLAQELGVSQAPVREALRELEFSGLVEQKPFSGTYVSVTKHGLQIPVDAGSYSEFAARMRDQEERFVRVFA